MYDHIKSLARMRAGDVPVGTSMHKAGGAPAPAPRPAGDARNTAAVVDAIRATATTTTTVGRARVTGFGPTAPPATEASRLHTHADAFQRRRGVVNTLGGAKDVTRQGRAPPPALPPKGAGGGGGARIGSFDTLATTGADGAARAANRARRDAANAGRGKFPQLTGSGVTVLVPKKR
jgi:hypothetical protein